jgi:probable F420-dependent oxidoreductase
LKLGVVFPQTEIGGDAGAVRAFIEGADELGFDHLGVYDHVLGADRATHTHLAGPYRTEHVFHEIFVLLGYAAAIAPRLELVPAVVIAPQRQTALLAKQAAEIDVLTGGNFRCGLGIGWNDVEYEALGEDFSNRGRRFEEQIEVLRLLWRDPVVTYEGRWHKITAAGLNPLPVRGTIPIWIGGSAEAALRRTARFADGYFPQRPLEGGWEATMEQMRGWLVEFGRDPAELGVEKRIAVGTRTPDEWRAEAEEWRGLGATHVSLVTMDGGLVGPDEHLERAREARVALLG